MKHLHLAFLALLLTQNLYANEPITPALDVKPDTWYAVDGLGRTLSVYDSGDGNYYRSGGVGDKKEKYVGLFYFTAQGYHSTYSYPYNITERLNSVSPETAEAAKNDYHHPLWKVEQSPPSWMWDKPLFGYYSTEDAFVLRKHAEMLADAGVDVVIFDCSVGLSTTASYRNVFEAFSQAERDGVRAPKIAFMLAMGNIEANKRDLRLLWEEIYSKNKWKERWFYWKGKPLILAFDNLLRETSKPEQADKEILNFFTFRKSDGFSPWSTENSLNGTTPIFPLWGWLNIFPQTKYYVNGKLEEMSVGVAQNVDVAAHKPTAMNGTNVAGRSYSKGDYHYSFTSAGKKMTVSSNTPQSVLYGINFQQQWDYAIQANPEFIFVTGWNEWAVGRYPEFLGIKNGFPDQFNTEYSRDAEPSSGILKDHYYYQLAENIRRFKGVSQPTKTNFMKTIDINGDLAQWQNIPSYDHYLRGTQDRQRRGYLGTFYENHTMRNDIIRAKVAYDETNIYFYVQTADNLTDVTDAAWMRLFIDTDFTGTANHWEGFEYVINRINPTATKAVLERSKGITQEKWQWETAGTVDYKRTDNVLQIAVPRTMLGLNDKDVTFNFKWSDNMQTEGDILDFYQNGDVAPGGRFTFHFSSQNK